MCSGKKIKKKLFYDLDALLNLGFYLNILGLLVLENDGRVGSALDAEMFTFRMEPELYTEFV